MSDDRLAMEELIRCARDRPKSLRNRIASRASSASVTDRQQREREERERDARRQRATIYCKCVFSPRCRTSTEREKSKSLISRDRFSLLTRDLTERQLHRLHSNSGIRFESTKEGNSRRDYSRSRSARWKKKKKKKRYVINALAQ